ncbi:unnamed protein product [Rodentolepis nana]|uniref:Uncharacterized protein n=1 Tax=Rodentolepis nana TaxID=102285 RepID=A0A0R3TVA2_RODNA|nr:unnamed protein product [Rodentolepis nana]
MRQRLILERCGASFVAKSPDVAIRSAPFVGVYSEPSFVNVHQEYNLNPFQPISDTAINDPISLSSNDANSDVIEIPFHSYLPRPSPSPDGSDNFYSRNEYRNNYKITEEENAEFNDIRTPLGYRKYEFDLTRACNVHSSAHFHSDSNRPH